MTIDSTTTRNSAAREVLTAFIREHSQEHWPAPDHGSPAAPPRPTRPDVQVAVTVVGRRDGAISDALTSPGRTSASRTSAAQTSATRTFPMRTSPRRTSQARSSAARTSAMRTSRARTSPGPGDDHGEADDCHNGRLAPWSLMSRSVIAAPLGVGRERMTVRTLPSPSSTELPGRRVTAG